MLLEYEIGIKLALCMIVGGIIGLEREISGHPAGLRTMMLVSCGSSTFIMIGYYGIGDPASTSRIIQGIATGLGFLGAGAIIKEGLNVRGLTTAASVWNTAAIGASIGMGLYRIAILTFLITIIALSLFGIFERALDLKPDNGKIILSAIPDDDMNHSISSFLRLKGIIIKRMEIKNDKIKQEIIYDVAIPRYIKKDRLLDGLRSMTGILKVTWMDSDYQIGP